MSKTTMLLRSGCCCTITLGGLIRLPLEVIRAFVSTTLFGMVIFWPGFRVPLPALLAGRTMTLFFDPVGPAMGMSCNLCTDNLLPLFTGVKPARLGPLNVTTLLPTGVIGVTTGFGVMVLFVASNAVGLWGAMWLIVVCWDAGDGMIVTPPEVDAWIIVFGGCSVIWSRMVI